MATDGPPGRSLRIYLPVIHGLNIIIHQPLLNKQEYKQVKFIHIRPILVKLLNISL